MIAQVVEVLLKAALVHIGGDQGVHDLDVLTTASLRLLDPVGVLTQDDGIDHRARLRRREEMNVSYIAHGPVMSM